MAGTGFTIIKIYSKRSTSNDHKVFLLTIYNWKIRCQKDLSVKSSTPKRNLRNPERLCYTSTIDIHFGKSKEGKIGYTKTKEKERNNVTDLEDYITTHLHHYRLY